MMFNLVDEVNLFTFRKIEDIKNIDDYKNIREYIKDRKILEILEEKAINSGKQILEMNRNVHEYINQKENLDFN